MEIVKLTLDAMLDLGKNISWGELVKRFSSMEEDLPEDTEI